MRQWATSALDTVRREIWTQVRRSDQKTVATELKDSRWALLRNPEHLTPTQAAKLAVVAQLNAPPYRAYLLKEHLRMVFHVGYDEASVRSSTGNHWLATGAFLANPGAVCGNPRDAASWWLIVDIDAHVMRWHRKTFGSEEAAAAGL